MRKPSDLKMYVNNKIKELAEAYIKYEEQGRMDLALACKYQLDILFTIQKICEERKKY